jgi:hypothetical protein
MASRPSVRQVRWQYAVANIGVVDAASRLAAVLGRLGADGWELVGVFDKASNVFSGMEKGFVLFKRPVGPAEEAEGGWAVQVDRHGRIVPATAAQDW